MCNRTNKLVIMLKNMLRLMLLMCVIKKWNKVYNKWLSMWNKVTYEHWTFVINI